jgi:hypothetical protein
MSSIIAVTAFQTGQFLHVDCAFSPEVCFPGGQTVQFGRAEATLK